MVLSLLPNQGGLLDQQGENVSKLAKKIIKGYHKTRKSSQLPETETQREYVAIGSRHIRRKRKPLSIEDRLTITHQVIAQKLSQADVAKEHGISP
jgi:hypothetical protein